MIRLYDRVDFLKYPASDEDFFTDLGKDADPEGDIDADMRKLIAAMNMPLMVLLHEFNPSNLPKCTRSVNGYYLRFALPINF